MDISGSLEQQKAAVMACFWLLDAPERLLEPTTPASEAILVPVPTPGNNAMEYMSMYTISAKYIIKCDGWRR